MELWNIVYLSFQIKVFGMNEQWKGGDVANGPGGGHKINILRDALKEYKNEDNTVVMFTDRYFSYIFVNFLICCKCTALGA